MALPVLTIWQTLDVLMDAGVIYLIAHDTDKAGNQLEMPQTLYYVFSAKDPETGVHKAVGTIAAQTFTTLFHNKLIWRIPIRGVNKQGETIIWYRLRKTTYATLGKWPGIITEYMGKPRDTTKETSVSEESAEQETPTTEKPSFWNIFKPKKE